MPPNALLKLPEESVVRNFALPTGQQRINQLFREAVGIPVGRAVVATVAQQDDYMKRLRENGGARSALRPEGIDPLPGQYSAHVQIARALLLPIPCPGETVSARVVPAFMPSLGVAPIDGGLLAALSSGRSRCGRAPTT